MNAGVAARINEGLALHQAGRLEEAEAIYRRVLVVDPGQPDALHLLGIAAYQRGRHDEAIALYERALARQPKFPPALNNLATALKDRGRLDEARRAIERALALSPDFLEALNTKGNILLALNDAGGAVAAFERAAQVNPKIAAIHANLGNALAALGRSEEADAAYRRAIAIDPAYAEAHFALGLLAARAGRLDDAEAAYRATVAARPDAAPAWNNLGNVLQDQGRLVEAVEAYGRAIAAAPSFAEAHANLANAYRGLARFDDAIASVRRALAIQPGSAIAHSNLGAFLKEKEDLPAAEAACRSAIALDPGLAEAHVNLSHILHGRGYYDETIASIDAAIAIPGGNRDGLRIKRALVLPVIMESHAQIEESRARVEREIDALLDRDLAISDPTREIAGASFYLAYHGRNDRPLQEKIARLYHKATPALAFTAPHCAAWAGPSGRRIRVGVYSQLLHDHTIGRLNQGLLEKLPRDRIELVLFRSPGPADSLSRAIDAAADRVVAVGSRLPQVRAAIAEAALDALYYPEIGMDTTTYFLACARLAPVQCVTWGHPVTTGIPTVDYFVSSADIETAEADDHYSERLVRLAALNTYYYRPDIPVHEETRASLGLPADATLYACPQTLFKFHPDFDRPIAAILRGDPRGLLLLVSGRDPRWDALLRARFARTMPDVVDRIRFLPPLPRRRFIGFLANLDVVLDPFPFGGGNSAYEALAMGAPIVTLPGRFMRGRITYALYNRMGVLDCVARDADDYAAIALRLGRDRAWRDHVVAELRRRTDLLFEVADAPAELGGFLVEAVEAARQRGRIGDRTGGAR